ncbi:polyketide synthase docking domain-containing protein [Streptomyces shenzhenensis]|uniref:polyketide synthase docking domain-containing protein n=1 Tax=Streptomyces shenzhenensis TaxID=943815 RepID=UPI0033F14F0A
MWAADAEEIARHKADVEALVGALRQSMAENGVVRQELSEESAWAGRCRSRKAAA